MAKFVYQFEAIRKVKENLEKKVQKEIALIDMEIGKLKKEHDLLEREEMMSRNNSGKKGMTVGDIKFKKGYELCLNRKRAVVSEKIERLSEKRELKMTELIQKSKEHKIFDTLEENLSENFTQEQNHLEMKFIDDIATQKFVRQNK